jgi:fibronectin type 3 domain-containing protein
MPGSDGGSAITNYQVWRGTTAGSETFHINAGLYPWYNDTGLINGQTYFYFIKAENAQGTGPGSNEVSVSPVHAAIEPSAPLGLVATPGNGEITLSWSAPANDGGSAVIGYNVYRGPTSGGETLIALLGNVLAHNDSGLTNGQTYFYVIRAVNAVGEGSQSNEASGVPNLDDTVPTAPTGLAATSGEANIYLNWTPPSYVGPGTIHYHLFRDGATLWSGTATEYNDTDVLGSITYSYTVAAENDLGWGPNSTEVSATPSGPGSVPPGAPTGLTVDAGNERIVLTWQAPIDPGSASISSYNVYRGTQSSSFTLVASINDTTYSDNNVTNGQQYHYQVSAVSMAGESDLTPEVTATPESSGSDNGIDMTLVIVIIAIVAVGILGALWYVRRK